MAMQTGRAALFDTGLDITNRFQPLTADVSRQQFSLSQALLWVPHLKCKSLSLRQAAGEDHLRRLTQRHRSQRAQVSASVCGATRIARIPSHARGTESNGAQDTPVFQFTHHLLLLYFPECRVMHICQWHSQKNSITKIKWATPLFGY